MKYNGKDVTKEEMEKAIKTDKITSVEFQTSGREGPASPATDHGVEISQEFMRKALQQMIRLNGTRAITTFTEVPDMMNKNVIVIIADANDPINEYIKKA